MTIRIRESDADGFDAARVDNPDSLDWFAPQYDIWGADPALVLERAEQEFGINCFDQPIN